MQRAGTARPLLGLCTALDVLFYAENAFFVADSHIYFAWTWDPLRAFFSYVVGLACSTAPRQVYGPRGEGGKAEPAVWCLVPSPIKGPGGGCKPPD